MTELLQLEKEVKKCKRVASEWAMQLHDLAEERLPTGFEELPQLAAATYEACQRWQQAVDALKAAQR